MVDVPENIINKLDGNYLARVNILSLDDLSERTLPKILHELVVLSDIVPFCCQNKIALLLFRSSLIHGDS